VVTLTRLPVVVKGFSLLAMEHQDGKGAYGSGRDLQLGGGGGEAMQSPLSKLHAAMLHPVSHAPSPGQLLGQPEAHCTDGAQSPLSKLHAATLHEESHDPSPGQLLGQPQSAGTDEVHAATEVHTVDNAVTAVAHVVAAVSAVVLTVQLYAASAVTDAAKLVPEATQVESYAAPNDT